MINSTSQFQFERKKVLNNDFSHKCLCKHIALFDNNNQIMNERNRKTLYLLGLRHHCGLLLMKCFLHFKFFSFSIKWLRTEGSPGCTIENLEMTNVKNLVRYDYKDFSIRF